MKEKKLKFKISGKDYNVVVENFGAYEAELRVNDRKYKIQIDDLGIEQAASLASFPNQVAPSPVPNTAKSESSAQPIAPSSSGASKVSAPMPGLVLSINVKVGDNVTVGQKLMVLEAMKMENDIEAEVAGVVSNIHVSQGDNVEEGKLLVSIG